MNRKKNLRKEWFFRLPESTVEYMHNWKTYHVYLHHIKNYWIITYYYCRISHSKSHILIFIHIQIDILVKLSSFLISLVPYLSRKAFFNDVGDNDKASMSSWTYYKKGKNIRTRPPLMTPLISCYSKRLPGPSSFYIFDIQIGSLFRVYSYLFT